MTEVRACVYFSVLFLCFQIAIGKPMFGLLWCDLLCDDDDDTSTTTTTTAGSEDYWDDFFCSGCEPIRPSTTAPPSPLTANPLIAGQPAINFILPSSGMNMTMSPQSGGSWFSFIPWGMPQGAAPPVPPAVINTAAPTAATAAPAAVTTAPAATTAAPAATTAAAATTTAATAGK